MRRVVAHRVAAAVAVRTAYDREAEMRREEELRQQSGRSGGMGNMGGMFGKQGQWVEQAAQQQQQRQNETPEEQRVRFEEEARQKQAQAKGTAPFNPWPKGSMPHQAWEQAYQQQLGSRAQQAQQQAGQAAGGQPQATNFGGAAGERHRGRTFAGFVIFVCGVEILRRNGFFGNFEHAQIPYWVSGYTDAANYVLFTLNVPDAARRKQLQQQYQHSRAAQPGLGFFDYVDTQEPFWRCSPSFPKEAVVATLTKSMQEKSLMTVAGSVQQAFSKVDAGGGMLSGLPGMGGQAAPQDGGAVTARRIDSLMASLGGQPGAYAGGYPAQPAYPQPPMGGYGMPMGQQYGWQPPMQPQGQAPPVGQNGDGDAAQPPMQYQQYQQPPQYQQQQYQQQQYQQYGYPAGYGQPMYQQYQQPPAAQPPLQQEAVPEAPVLVESPDAPQTQAQTQPQTQAPHGTDPLARAA